MRTPTHKMYRICKRMHKEFPVQSLRSYNVRWHALAELKVWLCRCVYKEFPVRALRVKSVVFSFATQLLEVANGVPATIVYLCNITFTNKSQQSSVGVLLANSHFCCTSFYTGHRSKKHMRSALAGASSLLQNT